MGKHVTKKNRRQKGFGTRGSGSRHGLKARLKVWQEILDNKAATRATVTGPSTAMFHRPGCKTAGYHKPGSNKK